MAPAVKSWPLIACLMLAVMLLTSSTRADPTARIFALVVANNRSVSMALPDLQYADDDAARYYRLFRARGGDGSVELNAWRIYTRRRDRSPSPCLIPPKSSAFLYK